MGWAADPVAAAAGACAIAAAPAANMLSRKDACWSSSAHGALCSRQQRHPVAGLCCYRCCCCCRRAKALAGVGHLHPACCSRHTQGEACSVLAATTTPCAGVQRQAG